MDTDKLVKLAREALSLEIKDAMSKKEREGLIVTREIVEGILTNLIK